VDRASPSDGATTSRAKLTFGRRAPGKERPWTRDGLPQRTASRGLGHGPPFTSVGERPKAARRVNLALQRTRPAATLCGNIKAPLGGSVC
jgi:hypothetical protein